MNIYQIHALLTVHVNILLQYQQQHCSITHHILKLTFSNVTECGNGAQTLGFPENN